MDDVSASCQYAADVVLSIRVACCLLLFPATICIFVGLVEERIDWIVPPVLVVALVAVMLILVPQTEVVIAWCSGG